MHDFFLDFVSKGKFIPDDYSVFIIDNVFLCGKRSPEQHTNAIYE